MADIAPLRPLRYASSQLAQLTAPPYDVISEAERQSLAARHRHNIVNLILPQPREGMGLESKYAQAGALFDEWVGTKVLTRDEEPAFYCYEQTFVTPGGALGDKITRHGFLALVRLVDFNERIVLPHERTLSGPKEDRLQLFRATKANLSPGFMLYRDPDRTLDQVFSTATLEARFVTQAASEFGPVENVLSKVSRRDAIEAVRSHIGKGTLLIADGHHRYETALYYSREVEAQRATSERAEHKYFMAFLANEDDSGLCVFPTHRLVTGLTPSLLLTLGTKLREYFDIREIHGQSVSQLMLLLQESGSSKPSFIMVRPDGHALLLALKSNFRSDQHAILSKRCAALQGTDVAILHDVVLEGLLSISLEAQAKQSNIVYLKDASDAVRRIQQGEGNLLFLMNATPVSQVRRVAEAGEVMPQKSTYFYPKVLTGLAIHTLTPSREVS